MKIVIANIHRVGFGYSWESYLEPEEGDFKLKLKEKCKICGSILTDFGCPNQDCIEGY
jgi:hypothetical protein